MINFSKILRWTFFIMIVVALVSLVISSMAFRDLSVYGHSFFDSWQAKVFVLSIAFFAALLTVCVTRSREVLKIIMG